MLVVLTGGWSDGEVGYHGTVYLLLGGRTEGPVSLLLVRVVLTSVLCTVMVWPLLRFEGRLGQHSGLGVSIVPWRWSELLHNPPSDELNVKIISSYFHCLPVDIRVVGDSSVLFPLISTSLNPSISQFLNPSEVLVWFLLEDD